MGIAGVLVLHGLLLWAIQSGLARQVVKVTENTVEALLLSDTLPKPPPPPKRLRIGQKAKNQNNYLT
jgi:protein TonB